MASTNTVVISILTRGTAQAAAGLAQLGAAASAAGAAVDRLNAIMAGISGAQALGQLVHMADAYTDIQNRLNLVSRANSELADTEERLFRIAQDTRAGFGDTVLLYTKMAQRTKALGVSSEDLYTSLTAINNSIAISGSNSIEARAGLIQFSQGLAANRLNGDELRSVLEQIPVLAEAIARGMGVAYGDLRRLGREGKLTAEQVIKALVSQSRDLQSAFNSTRATIDQGLTAFNNALTRYIGQIDQSWGITQRFNSLMQFLAANIKEVTSALYGMAAALALTFSRAILAQVLAMTAAVGRLFLLIMTHPLGAMIVALGAAIAAMWQFRDQITLTEGSLTTLGDYGRAAIEYIGMAVTWLVDNVVPSITAAWGIAGRSLANTFKFNVDQLFLVMKQFANSVIGTVVGLYNGFLATWRNLPGAFADLFISAINAAIKIVGDGINKFVDMANALYASFGVDQVERVPITELENKYAGYAARVGNAMREEFDKAYGVDYVSKMGNLLDNAWDNLQRRADAIGEERRRLEKEQMDANNRPFNQLLDTPGRAATEDEKASRNKKRLNELLQQEKAVLDMIRGPLIEYTTNMAALDRLMAKGAISQAEYVIGLKKIQMELLSTQTNFAAGLERGFQKTSDQIKDLATLSENLVTNAFGNLEDAFVDFVKTGEFNLQSFIDGVLADLARILFRLAMQWAGLGTMFGAPMGVATGSPMSLTPSFAAAQGGTFQVPGSGPPDSRLAAMLLSPGEMVDVRKPGQDSAPSGGVKVNIFNAPAGVKSVEEKRGQGGEIELDVVLAAVDEYLTQGIMRGNVGLAGAMEATYGRSRVGRY